MDISKSVFTCELNVYISIFYIIKQYRRTIAKHEFFCYNILYAEVTW